MAPLDQFVLFGDSLTQGSNDQSMGFAMASELQAVYMRRLDIINRGYSGYNTDHALEAVENTIPTAAQASVRFLTIWFGANDCNKDLEWNQHVPLARFKKNLLSIIHHPLVTAHTPKIILLTPPPVEETVLTEQLRAEDSPEGIRKAKDAAEYAEAVREVGKEAGVAVLDVWTDFMKAAGWEGGDAVLPGSIALGKDPVLAGLLYDGLHLSDKGYRRVYNGLMKLIVETWPDQNPARMPWARKVKWELDLGDTFWDINP